VFSDISLPVTASSATLNARGVAKYSDFGPMEGYISETVGGKLVLITNRKSYMSFRLVQKLVTLNDLERRNAVILRCFSEFGYLPGALFLYDVVVKQLLGLPRFQNLLLIVCGYIKTIYATIQRLFGQNKHNSV